MKAHVGIIGGGISGLISAYELKKKGYSVSLLEKKSRLGGWIDTEILQSRIFEWGPNTLFVNDDFSEWISQLGLSQRLAIPEVRARFIWKNNQKVALPLNPYELLRTSLLSTKTKWKIFIEAFGTTKFLDRDLSVSEFFETLFGAEVVNYVVDPMIGGIYSSSSRLISMKSFSPELWATFQQTGSLVRSVLKMRKKGGRKIVSFDSGLSQLVDAIHSHLDENQIHVDTEVHDVHLKPLKSWDVATNRGTFSFDHLFFACPAYQVAHLLRTYLSTTSQTFLRLLPYRDVSVWNTVFQRPLNFQSGLGCLIPPIEGLRLVGSLWPAESFPYRANPNEILSVQFFSGVSIPTEAELSYELSFLKRVLDVQTDPIFSQYRILRQAIPQLGVGHSAEVARLRASLPRGISLVGNYLDGVGVAQCYATAKRETQLFFEQAS